MCPLSTKIHSPGGVGGVAEAAAGDGVGMGPVNENE